MSSLPVNEVRTIGYSGDAESNFLLDDHHGLSVTIKTQRLSLKSLCASDETYRSYGRLFGDETVMKHFGTGRTIAYDDLVVKIRDIWAKQWKNHNPYGGFSVFSRDEDTFLGHVALFEDEPGTAELWYLFAKEHWGKGYATEAVTAIAKEFIPMLVARGYLVQGKALQTIVATAKPDNAGSIKVLEKLGMHKVREEEKYGALRYHFSADVKDLGQ